MSSGGVQQEQRHRSKKTESFWGKQVLTLQRVKSKGMTGTLVHFVTVLKFLKYSNFYLQSKANNIVLAVLT